MRPLSLSLPASSVRSPIQYGHRVALLCMLVQPLFVRAQSISLPGTVVIQNSEYETGKKIYVVDAGIRAPFAKAVASDKDGQFTLSFVGAEIGTSVRLLVTKVGLEVVNIEELERVVVGRSPSLNIRMADPDRMAQAREKFYGLIASAAQHGFESRMLVLRDTSTALSTRLQAVSAELNDTLASLGDAMYALTDQRDRALARAGELARELSSVDLDGASALFREAYDQFQLGMVDSALAVLSRKRLDGDYQNAVAQRSQGAGMIASANHAIRQVYESYGLKAAVLVAGIEFSEAGAVFDQMRRMLAMERDAFDARTDIELSHRIGTLHLNMGHYDAAGRELDSALASAVRSQPDDHVLLSDIWRDKGDLLSAMEHLDQAMEHYGNALALLDTLDDIGYDRSGGIHFLMGKALSVKGDFQNSLTHYRKAELVYRADTLRHGTDLSTLHASMSAVLWKIALYDEAMNEAQIALRIGSRHLPPGHPDLALAYLAVGMAWINKGEMDRALEYLGTSLDMQTRALGEDHPELTSSLEAMGHVLGVKGDHRGALSRYQRALCIRQRATGEDDLQVAACHSFIGATYSALRSRDSAVYHLRKSLATYNRVGMSDHWFTISVCAYLSEAFLAMDELDSAAFYADTALAKGRKLFGDGHPEVAYAYERVANVACARGQYGSAIGNYARALAIEDATGQGATDQASRMLCELGRAHLFNDDPDSCLIYMDRWKDIFSAKVRAGDPTAVRVRIDRAWALAKKGDLEAALTLCRQELDTVGTEKIVDPNILGSLHTTMGWALEQQGDLQGALSEYRSALGEYRETLSTLDWRMGRTHYYLGRVLLTMGDRSRAGLELDSSLAVQPSADVHWQRHHLAREEGDASGALNALILFMRDPHWHYGAMPCDLRLVKEELARSARALERYEVLKEFGLE